MKDKTGGPAFPNALLDESSNACHLVDGMTLRDYFAARAMQYVLSTEDFDWKKSEQGHIAAVSYAMADAMIKERDNKE